jgi:hypothetical protein
MVLDRTKGLGEEGINQFPKTAITSPYQIIHDKHLSTNGNRIIDKII